MLCCGILLERPDLDIELSTKSTIGVGFDEIAFSQLLVAVFKKSLNIGGTFGAFGDILEKSGISASKVGTVLRFSGVSTSPY